MWFDAIISAAVMIAWWILFCTSRVFSPIISLLQKQWQGKCDSSFDGVEAEIYVQSELETGCAQPSFSGCNQDENYVITWLRHGRENVGSLYFCRTEICPSTNQYSFSHPKYCHSFSFAIRRLSCQKSRILALYERKNYLCKDPELIVYKLWLLILKQLLYD